MMKSEKQGLGFTTGTLSGDLDAKYGANRTIEKAFVSVWLFWLVASIVVPCILVIFFAVPMMGFLAYFIDSAFVKELIAIFTPPK
jgi:uncharacterized membrane protein YgcG